MDIPRCTNCGHFAREWWCVSCEEPLCEACWLDADGFCAGCLADEQETREEEVIYPEQEISEYDWEVYVK